MICSTVAGVDWPSGITVITRRTTRRYHRIPARYCSPASMRVKLCISIPSGVSATWIRRPYRKPGTRLPVVNCESASTVVRSYWRQALREWGLCLQEPIPMTSKLRWVYPLSQHVSSTGYGAFGEAFCFAPITLMNWFHSAMVPVSALAPTLIHCRVRTPTKPTAVAVSCPKCSPNCATRTVAGAVALGLPVTRAIAALWVNQVMVPGWVFNMAVAAVWRI